MELTNEEKRILWIGLNNMQDGGMKSLAYIIDKMSKEVDAMPMVRDWINQTSKEHDIINTLKAKLCV